MVDSIKKSGTTIEAIRQYLIDKGLEPENFRSCCLVNSLAYQNTRAPEFFYKQLTGEVIFPWQTIHAGSAGVISGRRKPRAPAG